MKNKKIILVLLIVLLPLLSITNVMASEKMPQLTKEQVKKLTTKQKKEEKVLVASMVGYPLLSEIYKQCKPGNPFKETDRTNYKNCTNNALNAKYGFSKTKERLNFVKERATLLGEHGISKIADNLFKDY